MTQHSSLTRRLRISPACCAVAFKRLMGGFCCVSLTKTQDFPFFKVGVFSLGPVTGALFAGLFVGQFAHVPVSGMTKSFLFLLFLFGIGYSVGSQFMQSLKRDGLRPILLAVVVAITGQTASIRRYGSADRER